MADFARFSDPIGLIGVLLVLVAYLLLNMSKLKPLSFSYQFMNLFGAAFIFFSLLFNWNLSAAVIEVAWIIVSLIGIYRVILNKKKRAQ